MHGTLSHVVGYSAASRSNRVNHLEYSGLINAMAGSVRDDTSISQFLTYNCKLCGSEVNLKFCARCRSVAYCCKEHQSADWPEHKKYCREVTFAKTHVGEKMGIVTDRVKSLALDCQVAGVTSTNTTRPESDMRREIDANIEQYISSATEFGGAVGASSDLAYKGLDITQKQELATASKDSAGYNKEYKDIFSGSSEKFILESEEAELYEIAEASGSSQDMRGETAIATHTGNSGVLDESKSMYMSILQSRTVALSEYVTKCLNAYGVCVIDNFLGDSKGSDILNEVKSMYGRGDLKSGQLVNANSPNGRVRGDIINWVDGSENGCENICTLISTIDAIMLRCRKALDHYCVKGRSKAMCAVYPGNGTGFLRHVDNPNDDGRCVTCIYYLNKDWNSTTDGGLLRIFPEGQNKVANVEPKFDRLLFFWSDRRNPHEVLPAFRTRFAVTVWYYDQEERRRAVKKFKAGGQPT